MKTMMTTSILSPGEKIHMMMRRRFDKDIRRHFAGEIEAYENGVARARGHVFVLDDLNKHSFVKRPDKRTRLIPITDAELIVNVLPQSVNLDAIHYVLKDGSLTVTDGEWRMDIKEFGWS